MLVISLPSWPWPVLFCFCQWCIVNNILYTLGFEIGDILSYLMLAHILLCCFIHFNKKVGINLIQSFSHLVTNLSWFYFTDRDERCLLSFLCRWCTVSNLLYTLGSRNEGYLIALNAKSQASCYWATNMRRVFHYFFYRWSNLDVLRTKCAGEWVKNYVSYVVCLYL